MSANAVSTSAALTFTPYAAAKVVNAALLEAGIDKVIPAQMMYNYTTARARAGKATLIATVTVDDKVLITEAGLTEWLTKYIAKQTVTATA